MVESLKYSWAWVTADRLLSHGRCELIYALLAQSDYGTSTSFYDGENTSGDLVATLFHSEFSNYRFNPKVPVYCRRGLYVDIGTNTKVFVQWRELGHK